MASQDGAGRDVTDELTQIVRECVRNEIALQRSGSNTSFLMRTRDLIAMILLKGYFELRAGQSESEIRKSIITEVLEQRFPFVRPDLVVNENSRPYSEFSSIRELSLDKIKMIWSDERESLKSNLISNTFSYNLCQFFRNIAPCSVLRRHLYFMTGSVKLRI